MAAGAGAGLATAFNAPIAGAIFVLEELVRRFEHADRDRRPRRLGDRDRRRPRAILGDAAGFHCRARSTTCPRCGLPLFLVLGARRRAAGDRLQPLAARDARRVRTAAIAGRAEARAGAGRRGGRRAGLVRRRRWSAAATRSPSGRCRAPSRSPSCRCFSCCASRWARSPMRPERRAGCSRRCWCWARSSGCCSAPAAPLALSRPRHSSRRPSPWSAWRPSSPASCARR